MTADQFVRRDRWETLKLVVSNDIMSSSNGGSRVIPNTLANLGLPFRACGWRAKSHHLEERSRRRSTKKWLEGRSLVFPFIQLVFLWSRGNKRQGFILQVLNVGILVFTVPSGHFCKERVSRVKIYKVRQERTKILLFSSWEIFFKMYTEGSGPRQHSYRRRGLSSSLKSSTVKANSRVALIHPW